MQQYKNEEDSFRINILYKLKVNSLFNEKEALHRKLNLALR